jgi:hypothetical protein
MRCDDGAVIRPLTWIVVLLLVAGYVAFFANRYRREQAAKRTVEPPPARPVAAMPASPPLQPLPPVVAPPAPAPAGGPPEAPPPGPDGPAGTGGDVADLIRGIRLPEDLVPRPDVIPRPGAHDRVVFVTTDAPADVVRDRLVAALEAIGAEVRWDADGWLAMLSRDGRSGWLRVHPSPTGIVPAGTLLAPTVPHHTVCAEFWTDTV